MADDDFELEGKLVETVARRGANPNLLIGAAAAGAAVLFLGVVAYTSNAKKPKKPAESAEVFNTARMEPNIGFDKPPTKEENKLTLPAATTVTPPVSQGPLIVPADQGVVDDAAAREAAELEKRRKEEEARRLARLRSPMIVVDLKDASASAGEGGAVRVQAQDEEKDENRRFQQNVSGQEVDVARARKNNRIDALVPQGTFIRASLETAIQSDLPGMVRAITSEDVYSFDGRRVLLPKGTMLTGEYRSAIARGQTRVFIVWTRILRADGVSLMLGSNGADDLGRAGMAGEVDNHYFERFGSAILMTVVGGVAQMAGSIGQYMGGQQNQGQGYVLDPITGQLTALYNQNAQMLQYGAQIGGQTIARTLTQLAQEALKDSIGIKPTIYIDQGAKVIVFVKRDLDFSGLYPDPVKEALYELQHPSRDKGRRGGVAVGDAAALPAPGGRAYSGVVTKP